MKNPLVVVIACLALTSLLHSQEIKWPVFSVKYDGGLGSEQIEQEEEIEPSSYRHTVTLRIKEELAAALIVNLYTEITEGYENYPRWATLIGGWGVVLFWAVLGYYLWKRPSKSDVLKGD